MDRAARKVKQKGGSLRLNQVLSNMQNEDMLGLPNYMADQRSKKLNTIIQNMASHTPLI